MNSGNDGSQAGRRKHHHLLCPPESNGCVARYGRISHSYRNLDRAKHFAILAVAQWEGTIGTAARRIVGAVPKNDWFRGPSAYNSVQLSVVCLISMEQVARLQREFVVHFEYGNGTGD